jgi:hypothetical protein
MSAFKANPFAYILPALILLGVIGYYVYGALDRYGLDTRSAQARVTGKQFTPGSTTYNTNIAAGRAWTQSTQNPDAYVVTLEVEGQPGSAYVTAELFATLQAGDALAVEVSRTRFSRQLQVVVVGRAP